MVGAAQWSRPRRLIGDRRRGPVDDGARRPRGRIPGERATRSARHRRGAGFIGSTLVDRLLAEGHAVDVIDDLSTGSLANLAEARADRSNELTFHQVDIRSEAVVDVIARRQPEVVFHLAAQADVRVSVARPVFDAEVNVLGSLNVLEGARRRARARLCSPRAAARSTATPTRPSSR